MEKMFMRVSEVTEALDVSKSYAYKFFYEQFYGTQSYERRN